MAQDDYYYEIQLTNKQLVFYFMAGATGLILSFLAGVMVGRSVEGTALPRSARSATEERVVTEETPRPLATPTVIDLTYAQRLEADRPDEMVAASPRSPATAVPTPEPTSTPLPTPRPTPKLSPPTPRPALTPLPPTPKPRASAAPTTSPARGRDPKPPPARVAWPTKPKPGTFACQVGAFKDRATADQVVARLRGRGYEAFSVEDNGLFPVRVGNHAARADAERVLTRLRDEEKFRPYIVKQ